MISKTYGEALFESALEKNEIDNISEQITVLSKAFADNPELIKLLSHPKITKEEKEEVIGKIFDKRVDEDIIAFFKIIAEKDRFADINGILDYFEARVREYKKIGVAYVTSAVALTDAQKKKIEKKLTEQTKYVSFIMNYKVDPSLIGGMTIKIGDRVADSSIRSKLERMTRELKKVSVE